MKINVNKIDADRTIRRLGLEPGGRVQQFHTLNVVRRIKRYLPKRDRDFVTKALVMGTNARDGKIKVALPYAHFLYAGKVMIGRFSHRVWALKDERKEITDRDLTYNTEQNALAGPAWDRRLVQNEIHLIEAELKACIEGKGKA